MLKAKPSTLHRGKTYRAVAGPFDGSAMEYRGRRIFLRLTNGFSGFYELTSIPLGHRRGYVYRYQWMGA